MTVKLTIQNRQATVSVIPSASSMVIRALKEPLRDRKKVKNGNVSTAVTFSKYKVVCSENIGSNGLSVVNTRAVMYAYNLKTELDASNDAHDIVVDCQPYVK